MIRRNVRIDYILNPYSSDWRMEQQSIEGLWTYNETISILKNIQLKHSLKPIVVGLKIEEKYYGLGSRQVVALQQAI